MNRTRLKENLDAVLGRIADAAARSGRSRDSVRLVAVVKRRPVDQIRALVDLGPRDLGENYPQELWSKVEALPDPTIRWHLIGHLQGNKAKRTLPLVELTHGVDSLKLLKSIDALAGDLPRRPRVCLQINTSGEESKHGWTSHAVLADADAIAPLRSVEIVGLMTMAALGSDDESARASFRTLRDTRDALRRSTGLTLDELSMGMSSDFVPAIEEGATLVRVGSALFEGVDE